jgi:hypothetical protein
MGEISLDREALFVFRSHHDEPVEARQADVSDRL